MPDTKISALTAMLGDEVSSGDLFVVVDVNVNTTKKITRDELFKAAADMIIRGNIPTLELRELDGAVGYNGWRLRRNSNVNYFDTMADGVLVATDYAATTDATGVITHAWRISGAEKFRIHSNGYVGVNQTSPLVPLDVDGDSVIRGVGYLFQSAPISKGVAATLTAVEMLNGIINYTGAVANLTLPTATDMVAGMPASIQNNISFDFSVINTGSGTATVVTNTGMTLVGGMAVTAGTSGSFRARKLTATTMAIYRLA